MDYYMKLPRNKKEFALFMAIISIISVNIIAPLITCFEAGFTIDSWANTYHAIPYIWIAVVALVLVTYIPASKMTEKILAKEDSFNAHIIINVLCTVLMMSVVLTIIGTWIGTQSISTDPFIHFFYKWPRNFAISLGIELLIAQPVARYLMLNLHQSRDKHN